MSTHFTLDGFDPLSEPATGEERIVFEDATKRVVLNILRSYTGYYDAFSEIIQNSLDAIDEKRPKEAGYKPKLTILVNIQQGMIRVVDNGVGMSLEQFKFCIRPNVSFKHRRVLRATRAMPGRKAPRASKVRLDQLEPPARPVPQDRRGCARCGRTAAAPAANARWPAKRARPWLP